MDILKYIATIKEVQSVSTETLSGLAKSQLQLSQDITTKEPVAQGCSEKKALKPNHLLSVSETCGMSSALRPQSRSELFDVSPDTNK